MKLYKSNNFNAVLNKYDKQLASFYVNNSNEALVLALLNVKGYKISTDIMNYMQSVYKKDIKAAVDKDEYKYYTKIGFYAERDIYNSDKILMRKPYKFNSQKSITKKCNDFTYRTLVKSK